MNAIHTLRRGLAFLGLCALVAVAGCDTVDELLEAENPAAIREDQLDDPTLANVLVNSVIRALTEAYADPIIWDGSKLTDEHVSGINWPETKDLGKRVLPYNVGPAETMYGALQRFRFMADSVATRLETLLEKPNEDRRMALVLAYGGYAYVFMAEILCEATIDVGSKRYTPQELFEIAIQKFQRAVQVAEAAGAEAEDVKNLAYTGLARAAIGAGNKALAMDAAEEVPSDFVWWVEYKNQVFANELAGHARGGNHNIGVHPIVLSRFGTYGETIPPEAQTDPRIQFNPEPRLGHDAQTILYTPYQSLSYSEYTGGLQTDSIPSRRPPTLENDTDIRLGSYIDAMHNYYEAAGPDGVGPEGPTLEFVNKRRAVGNQPPVTLSGDALMAELREQRLRDLFFGGFRLGDLRRWKAQGVGDFFPKGTHPNPVMGEYGTAECFPIPLDEFVANPGIR
mgnify:CR=1 FL=1